MSNFKEAMKQSQKDMIERHKDVPDIIKATIIKTVKTEDAYAIIACLSMLSVEIVKLDKKFEKLRAAHIALIDKEYSDEEEESGNKSD